MLASSVTAFADEARAEDEAAQAPSDESSDLRERLARQERASLELQTRLAAFERAQRDAAATTPRSSDQIVTSGYVHLDWVALRQSSADEVNPSSGEPLNENRFLLRRGRLRVETDRGLIHGALEIDTNTIRGPQVRPWNAEASIKWPASTPYRGPAAIAQESVKAPFFIVSAGLLMTPFGFDVAELDRTRPFLERTTFANELVPQSYDLGLRVMGGFGIVNYALGIMNGSPIGERTFPGRDPNESKDLVGRVGVSTEVVKRVRADAGVSAITGRGFHKGELPSKDQLVWRDQNEDGIVQQTELQVVPGAPATPSEGFQRFALGADARVHVDVPVVGELLLRVEIVRAKNMARGTFVADPVATSRDARGLGWSAAATQELTRWSMVGMRYDTFDPDADAREQRPFAVVPIDASVSTWAFMAMARMQNARLVVEYDHRRNAFGRDVTGAPTTLADDSLTFRAMVGF